MKRAAERSMNHSTGKKALTTVQNTFKTSKSTQSAATNLLFTKAHLRLIRVMILMYYSGAFEILEKCLPSYEDIFKRALMIPITRKTREAHVLVLENYRSATVNAKV